MKRLILAALVVAASASMGSPAFAGSAPAPAAIGGPAKQTGIGGPSKPTALMPSQKSGTATVPPTPCANCVSRTKK